MAGSVTESQLLSHLADKHRYVECEESESECESDLGEVVIACLQIPIHSPVRVRATVQLGCREEHLPSPLSPLTLLSRRLAHRLRGDRLPSPPPPDLEALEAAWRRAAATQTSCTSSTAALPSPTPLRQQMSPRASQYYTAPSTPVAATPHHVRAARAQQEASRQQESTLRMRKLRKALLKTEREQVENARRKIEREEEEEARRLEAVGGYKGEEKEMWREVPCSPCTKCKKRILKENKVEETKKPVIRDILFGCFRSVKH